MHNQNKNRSFEDLTFDLESLVFFQLEQWLETKGPCLQNYKELLSVAPRRGQLQSKVWIKRDNGELVVLKTFDRLNLKTIQRAILNEIVVPFVVDSPYVLKPSEFFIENEVYWFCYYFIFEKIILKIFVHLKLILRYSILSFLFKEEQIFAIF